MVTNNDDRNCHFRSGGRDDESGAGAGTNVCGR